MKLRPYQEAALRELVASLRTQKDVLLQASCGAGKTILAAALIRTYMERYPQLHILFLAHREQLVRQTREKLLKWWPEGEEQISMACAAVGRVDVSRPVIIGSPQTIAHRLDGMPPVHLAIVDEAHRLPLKSSGGQYAAIIDALRARYGQMRLLGVTATPYRLKHGYIYGGDCLHPEDNWFPELCWSIGIRELQEQGYLCPLDVLTAATPDLTKVRVSKTGDYDFGALTDLMGQDVHLDSAVKAFEKYASDRRHVVVFAVTIAHAEMLARRFRMAGHEAGVVHSELPHAERMETLKAFDEGRLRFVVNVGVLTEGWDSTAIDCIVLCRPTKSTALYVQMVGRGLRTHPGKKDCLLLDLSGNFAAHGDVSDPQVTWPRPKPAEPGVPLRSGGALLCPQCRAEISPKDIFCPACHAELKTVRNDCPTLTRPVLDSQAWPRAMAVCGKPRIFPFFYTRAGHRMIRIMLRCMDVSAKEYSVSAFLDIEGQAGFWARAKAERIWRELSHDRRPPSTLAEAKERLGELRFPSAVLVGRSKKTQHFNVARWYA